MSRTSTYIHVHVPSTTTNFGPDGPEFPNTISLQSTTQIHHLCMIKFNYLNYQISLFLLPQVRLGDPGHGSLARLPPDLYHIAGKSLPENNSLSASIRFYISLGGWIALFVEKDKHTTCNLRYRLQLLITTSAVFGEVTGSFLIPRLLPTVHSSKRWERA